MHPALTQAENVTIILISIIDGGMSQLYYYYYYYLNYSLSTNHPSVRVMKLEIDTTYMN